MRLHNTQKGFSIVEIVIGLAVVGLIGFLGYVAYNNMQSAKVANGTPVSVQSPVANDVKTAAPINSVSGLDTALSTLDQTDTSGSNSTDAGQLDSEVSTF